MSIEFCAHSYLSAAYNSKAEKNYDTNAIQNRVCSICRVQYC